MSLEVFTVLYVATAFKFCSNVMNHDSDSEIMSDGLGIGSPQPSGGAGVYAVSGGFPH